MSRQIHSNENIPTSLDVHGKEIVVYQPVCYYNEASRNTDTHEWYTEWYLIYVLACILFYVVTGKIKNTWAYFAEWLHYNSSNIMEVIVRFF